MPMPAVSDGTSAPVTTSSKSADTLRKAVDALAIVPTKQRIFPLARKLYNALLFLAQKQGWEQDIYRATLSEIVSKARFTSKDSEIIKNHLRQMNTTPVEWQSPTRGEGSRWDISNLIAHASVITSGSGRAIEIEWSFAPNIKRELLARSGSRKSHCTFSPRCEPTLASRSSRSAHGTSTTLKGLRHAMLGA